MTEPLVSVMMLTYNHVRHVAEAIEKVVAQKVTFPFELVIGEDCSTDGTRELVLKARDTYPDIIRVIASSSNVGMKQNAYRTIKACRGKYIAFCEGDDYWHRPHKLQKQVDYLEDHPECGLVFSSFDVDHLASNELIPDFVEYRNWRIPPDPGLWDVLTFDWVLTCTVMTRRTLTHQVIDADHYLHQSEHFLMGDHQRWVEIAAIAGTHYLAESLATYRVTEESATRSKDPRKVFRFRTSAAELCVYLCHKYNAPAAILAKHETAWRDVALRLAFHARDGGLADEVRRRQARLTMEEWLRYYGARHSVIYHGYRLASSVLGLVRKRRDQWR